MTVSSSTNSNRYSGNGSTTVFAYAFKIFADADLRVVLKNNTTGAETLQTLTTDYTVSNAGNDSGGNVTFVTAPASGNTVIIRRELSYTQETNYVENDPFPAQAHEDALDRATMLAQQNDTNIGLAIQFPEGDVGAGLDNVLPSAVSRASKFLAFDSDGSIVMSPSTEFAGSIALGDWIIKVDSNELVFEYDGTDVFKVGTDGAITSADNVTAYGTI